MYQVTIGLPALHETSWSNKQNCNQHQKVFLLQRAAISKEKLQQYFNNIDTELKDVPSSNIWNYDETNLRDDPGARKYVMKRRTK